MPQRATRLWQRPGRLRSRRGRSGSSGVCLLVSGLFLLAQQSTLENYCRNPLISVIATKKYRDPTLARESSSYDVLPFHVRTPFVPQVTKGQLLYSVKDL